jgi:hypothetical protein
MKIIASLPEAKHYNPLQSTVEGRWLFQDKASSAARIQAPTPDPWGQQWKIVPSMQMQKGDDSKWPYRLVIKLFPLDGEGIPAQFERERVKGLFAWADYQPLAFYAFPSGEKTWLFYSFYQQ